MDTDAPPPIYFSRLLRWHRQAGGLTQEALAERAKVSTRAINDLERGRRRPRPDTVTLLVKALALSQPEEMILRAAAVGQRPSAVEESTALALHAAARADDVPGGGQARTKTGVQKVLAEQGHTPAAVEQ